MRASESSARDNRVEAHPEKPRGRTCHHLCTLIVVTHDVYLSLGRHGMHIPSESSRQTKFVVYSSFRIVLEGMGSSGHTSVLGDIRADCESDTVSQSDPRALDGYEGYDMPGAELRSSS